MEGFFEVIKTKFADLSVLELTGIWLAVASYREIFKPLHKLLSTLAEAIKSGELSHEGIETRLAKLTAAIEENRPSQS